MPLPQHCGALWSICVILIVAKSPAADGFSVHPSVREPHVSSSSLWATEHSFSDQSRRSALTKTLPSLLALSTATAIPSAARGMVGSLPELAETNVVIQCVTVQVADPSQRTAMVDFLQKGFGMEIQRQRIQGSREEVWMGYGPEQLSIPKDFTLPVSSFAKYGGHASIRIVYDSKTTNPYYKIGDTSPSDNSNVAYLQLGVPEYRISQMSKNGGTILDAYGIVNVISPAGLPIRGIVGISPDPIMFLAINCADAQATAQQFYGQQLGFQVRPYPYCRPGEGKGVFEPEQPKRSIYMAPPGNGGMGVLLLQSKKKKVAVNPAVGGMTLVYQPSDDGDAGAPPVLMDPSGLNINFQPYKEFEKEEIATR